MQYKFFTIPAVNTTEWEEELNRFLRGHRVLNVHRDFVNNGSQSCWCYSVEYLENGGNVGPGTWNHGRNKRVDYREVLKEHEFNRFKVLRECRKKVAEEDAVPAFAVFIDEQLAEMAKLEQMTLQELKKINGIGERKLEKYGARFLKLIEEQKDETGGESVSENS